MDAMEFGGERFVNWILPEQQDRLSAWTRRASSEIPATVEALAFSVFSGVALPVPVSHRKLWCLRLSSDCCLRLYTPPHAAAHDESGKKKEPIPAIHRHPPKAKTIFIAINVAMSLLIETMIDQFPP